jgi:ferredoxin
VRFIVKDGFESLLAELRARGFDLVGPTVRDGAILLDRVEGLADLPLGVREVEEPGRFRLERTGDGRPFGFAHGPDSAKRFLFPARETVAMVERDGARLTVAPARSDEPPLALIGLRSCDLHAIAIQDRVFMSDPAYRRRRESLFVVAVNCSQPGGTCFCGSMGTGPKCDSGFDLALTELAGGFLVEVGTEAGGDLLEAVGSREATVEELDAGRRVWASASERLGRTVRTDGVRELLYRNREHPRWKELAERCLACGNCTAVCPTCFCHDVSDLQEPLGDRSARIREWASCFSDEFSHVVGGEVRTSTSAKYRQWLTHKFASWVDQFGMSGCVGCGRCITWCPVGIDITEELEAIRATDGAEEVPA